VHIEAGCRSYDMRMPEEINRRATDHISDLLLAVSAHAAETLAGERVVGRVMQVGDPQFDVFNERKTPFVARAERRGGLLTLHRQENADDPERLRSLLHEIAAADPELEWVFPVHPRTRKNLHDVPETIMATEPLLYGELLETLVRARVCVTDSGGLQKEAFWARVPCVTVRETTEWVETVAQGANELAQPGGVRGAVERALAKELTELYENPYGDGNASAQIAEALRAWLSDSEAERRRGAA
jgi:UDP-N-acetylglucosamine 2-epimerase